jgi:hypothetical protein
MDTEEVNCVSDRARISETVGQEMGNSMSGRHDGCESEAKEEDPGTGLSLMAMFKFFGG